MLYFQMTGRAIQIHTKLLEYFTQSLISYGKFGFSGMRGDIFSVFSLVFNAKLLEFLCRVVTGVTPLVKNTYRVKALRRLRCKAWF